MLVMPTESSRLLPTQYASTTRASSGSGMPLRAGDQLQVGPRAGEALGQLAESLVRDAGLAVVQQGVAVRRPAAAPRIGRVGIADKQLGTVDNHHVATFCKASSERSTGPRADKGRATR